jgi:hypothetical protein
MRQSLLDKVVHCSPELACCFLAAPFSLLKEVFIEYHAISIEEHNNKSIPVL